MTLLTDHLRAMAGAFGDEVAYTIVDGGEMTFAQWDGESNRLARSLTGHGVERGDRVAIYMPAEEALRWVIGYSAVHKAGGVAVPTNIRLAVPKLVHQLADAEVKVILCDVTLEPLAREAIDAMMKDGSGSSQSPISRPLIKVAPGGDPPFSWENRRTRTNRRTKFRWAPTISPTSSTHLERQADRKVSRSGIATPH